MPREGTSMRASWGTAKTLGKFDPDCETGSRKQNKAKNGAGVKERETHRKEAEKGTGGMQGHSKHTQRLSRTGSFSVYKKKTSKSYFRFQKNEIVSRTLNNNKSVSLCKLIFSINTRTKKCKATQRADSGNQIIAVGAKSPSFFLVAWAPEETVTLLTVRIISVIAVIMWLIRQYQIAGWDVTPRNCDGRGRPGFGAAARGTVFRRRMRTEGRKRRAWLQPGKSFPTTGSLLRENGKSEKSLHFHYPSSFVLEKHFRLPLIWACIRVKCLREPLSEGSK